MEEVEERHGDVVILEEWGIIDRWWTGEPIRYQYREVVWNNRRITFRQILPNKTWKVFKIGSKWSE